MKITEVSWIRISRSEHNFVRANLRSFLEQLPPDQHAADFAGAGTNLVELGVAQQTPRGIVVDIAVAAEQLDGVESAWVAFSAA